MKSNERLFLYTIKELDDKYNDVTVICLESKDKLLWVAPDIMLEDSKRYYYNFQEGHSWYKRVKKQERRGDGTLIYEKLNPGEFKEKKMLLSADPVIVSMGGKLLKKRLMKDGNKENK